MTAPIAHWTPRTIAALLAVALTASPASAEEYKIVPNTSRVSFTSDAPFETIVGTTAAVNGTITVSPDAPNRGADGDVEVDMATIRTGVDLRDEHFRGEQWLDTSTYPKATFELEKVELPAGTKLAYGNRVEGTAQGALTIRGNTDNVRVPITVGLYRPNEKLKQFGLDDDVIRVKTRFDVELSDFGVNPPEHLAGLKVAETVEIALDLTAVKQ